MKYVNRIFFVFAGIAGIPKGCDISKLTLKIYRTQFLIRKNTRLFIFRTTNLSFEATELRIFVSMRITICHQPITDVILFTLHHSSI